MNKSAGSLVRRASNMPLIRWLGKLEPRCTRRSAKRGECWFTVPSPARLFGWEPTHDSFWRAVASWKCFGSATGFPSLMRQHDIIYLRKSSRSYAMAFSWPLVTRVHSPSTTFAQPSHKQNPLAGRERYCSYLTRKLPQELE